MIKQVLLRIREMMFHFKNISRTTYRVYVDDADLIELKINGVPYIVSDVSGSGIGFYLQNSDAFNVMDEVYPISLKFGEQSFCGISGNIVHISLLKDGSHICGLRFVNIDNQLKSSLGGYIHSKIAYRLRKE